MTEPANLQADALASADHAAVMVMLLDDEQAARVLGALEPEELRIIGDKMCSLGEIHPEAIVRSIAGFVAANEEQGLSSHDRQGKVHTMMTRAVGDVRANNLMRKIAPQAAAPKSLEIVRWLSSEVLISLIQDEHPQVIAVLLVQLDPDVAAEVLYGLSWRVQPEVVHRVATMGPVSAEALAMLDETLSARLGELKDQGSIKLGGITNAADLINNSGKAAEKRIMAEINKTDKPIAKQLESEMFKFEHLLVLDPQQMGSLLREVESAALIDALKGIEDEQREVFFRAMSSRAADGV
ncbi:MAG: Flagellar motor switch protein FliG, partial [Novosphingobium sp.]|nr:Flagellar motor switch protein FliG [Novosphingobium sp.]